MLLTKLRYTCPKKKVSFTLSLANICSLVSDDNYF